MTQLFDIDLGERIPATACTPARPGTGPTGETCQTCYHKARGHRFLKCSLMRHAWTHGAGTDIKARWPACYEWEPVYANYLEWREDYGKAFGRGPMSEVDWLVFADYLEEQGDTRCEAIRHYFTPHGRSNNASTLTQT